MQQLLNTLVERNKRWTKEGKVATYIPELGKGDPSVLGISIIDLNGNLYNAGDYKYKFTLQSITKVVTLMLALIENGKEKVFQYVGMEPTGDPFNSIIKLETIKPSKPLNPMINAGAITTVSLISGESPEERLHKILTLIHKMTGNYGITYNEKVFQSEYQTGDLNKALAYFLRTHNVITGDIEEHLEVYFKQSSIEVTTEDVAKIGAVIANDGKDIYNNQEIIPYEVVRIAKTFMVTCGMYNASGEFAINVGIPAKSGVGGGILATVPRRFGIGVVGPALDEKGNSIGGVKLLEDLSQKLDLSIF
ncbi:glutaminase A [Vulcanibacillus modesticaldus]|uniref:Glutaminase n=2 Tax=Vulcanibacillus modesticaldus TaxID=337097 RepID=A0A1D2YTI9_9BACI|nr:glutaminase A [Vulcanibacillus modesticaldus]